jgi:hypothetical protein
LHDQWIICSIAELQFHAKSFHVSKMS